MNAILSLALLSACLRAEGFLVFDGGGPTHYSVEAAGRLIKAGASPTGDIDDYFAARGRLYRLDALLGKVSELAPDLTPGKTASVKSKTGVPEWLGEWDKGVLVLCDNAVVYLDRELKEAGRAALEPRKSGEVTPVLSLKDFAAFDKRGYLLVGTNEVFVLPLDRPALGSFKAAVSVGYELQLDGLWLDPEDRTLNLLGAEREEGLPADEGVAGTVTAERQKVLAYELADLAREPRSAVVHEERVLHTPRPIRLQDEDDAHDPRRGDAIIDRIPPFRTLSKTGTYIGVRSRTTPAYAETFPRETGGFGRVLARLRTLGATQPVELRRDSEEGPLWFEAGGLRLYPETDMTGRVIRLQPGSYGELMRQPGVRLHYAKALAY